MRPRSEATPPGCDDICTFGAFHGAVKHMASAHREHPESRPTWRSDRSAPGAEPPAATSGGHTRVRRPGHPVRARGRRGDLLCASLGLGPSARPLLRLPGADGGDALADRYLEALGRPLRVVEA